MVRRVLVNPLKPSTIENLGPVGRSFHASLAMPDGASADDDLPDTLSLRHELRPHGREAF